MRYRNDCCHINTSPESATAAHLNLDAIHIQLTECQAKGAAFDDQKTQDMVQCTVEQVLEMRQKQGGLWLILSL